MSLSVTHRIWLLVALVATSSIAAVLLGRSTARTLETAAASALTQRAEADDRVQVRSLVRSTASLLGAAAAAETEPADRLAKARTMLRTAGFFVDDAERKPSGAFFIIDADGTCLAHPSRPDLEGRNVRSIADATGHRPFADLITAAATGGGFTTASWAGAGGGGPRPMLAYAETVPGTPWILGTAVPTDETAARTIIMQDELAATRASAFRSQLLLLAAYLGLIVAPAAFIMIRQTLTRPMARITRCLRDVSSGDGDLTRRLEVTTRDELAEMSEALNAVLEDIERLTGEIGGGVHELADDARAVAASSTHLAENATQQAGTLQQINASIEQIASMTEESGRQCVQVGRRSTEAADIALSASEDMGRLSEGMESIDASSREMLTVIRVIDEIAFQTNLLALNAAVEAARAGEAGKGFAVVAEEVRSLASRSAEAARQTSDLIRASITRAEAGRSLVDAVAEGFERIREANAEVRDALQSVVHSTTQQRDGLETIIGGTRDLDRIARDTAAAAEELSASAIDADGRCRQLTACVGRYRVRGGAKNAKATVSPAARPVASPASATAKPAALPKKPAAVTPAKSPAKSPAPAAAKPAASPKKQAAVTLAKSPATSRPTAAAPAKGPTRSAATPVPASGVPAPAPAPARPRVAPAADLEDFDDFEFDAELMKGFDD